MIRLVLTAILPAQASPATPSDVQVSFPAGARHGTAFTVPTDVAARLR